MNLSAWELASGLPETEASHVNGYSRLSAIIRRAPGDRPLTQNAVIDYPDGSHRALYCMEAPEAWFEDFGRASLAGGSAAVTLEPRFAALVDDDEYHVFVTPEGDCKGLYVESRSRDGFAVRECQNGTSDVAFSYRLAIRRTDIDNERFKSVQLPALPRPAPAGEAARQAEALLHRAEQSRPRGKPSTS